MGNEDSILQCRHSTTTRNSFHFNDAGVTCSDNSKGIIDLITLHNLLYVGELIYFNFFSMLKSQRTVQLVQYNL